MKWMRVALVLTSVAALPMFAADRTFDLTGWAARVDTNSDGTFTAPSAGQPLKVSFDGRLGYGIGANIFLGENISVSLDAVQVRPKTIIRSRAVGGGGSTNGMRMTPLSAVLQ